MPTRNSYRTTYENQVAQLGDETPKPEDDEPIDTALQKAAIEKVQRLVCANAPDAPDASEILQALGIHPNQEDPRTGLYPIAGRVYLGPVTTSLTSPRKKT